MDHLTNLDKSRIVSFITEERPSNPDWFFQSEDRNFASPAELVIYFSAFCVALSHADDALKEVESILKRVKSIIASWKSLQTKDTKGADTAGGLKLKLDEKVVVVIYRSMCAGDGGLTVTELTDRADAAAPAIESVLTRLANHQIVTKGPKSGKWKLLLPE